EGLHVDLVLLVVVEVFGRVEQDRFMEDWYLTDLFIVERCDEYAHIQAAGLEVVNDFLGLHFGDRKRSARVCSQKAVEQPWQQVRGESGDYTQCDFAVG